MKVPILLSLGCGAAIFWAGYTNAYFPQNDVFSYYQLFHYTYSAALLNRQIPLWEPYAGYGLPSGFELAFTFGPTKCLAALLGFLFDITDIKALFFGAIGVDFALLGLATAWLVRDLTGTSGPHVCLAAALMPLSHYFETTTNWGYGFALTMVFVLLFLLRFLQTRRAVYLAATGLTLVANIYGNPQYLVIPETYLTLLFLLMAGLRFRQQLTAEWRSIIRSLFTLPSIAIGALTAGLLVGLLLIDHESWKTLVFTPVDRDPNTLKPSLKVFLYYVYLTPVRRMWDLFTGRPITTPDNWLYFGVTGLTVLPFALLRGWRIKFVPELLILVTLTTAFSLPALCPLAKWAYYWAPGMYLYRSANYASVFAKPFAILAVASVLADPRILEEGSRRSLLIVTLAATIYAGLLQYLHVPASYYVDSFAYGWIAIGALLILLIALVVFNGPRWERWAPLLLAFILVGEIVIHRIVFEARLYDSLADHKSPNNSGDLALSGPWGGMSAELSDGVRDPGFNSSSRQQVIALLSLEQQLKHGIFGDVTVPASPYQTTLYYNLLTEAPAVIRIKPWYKTPRRLVYQSQRFQPAPFPPVLPFSDRFTGALYHGLWSFLSVDPCVPMTRSDSYVRWIAAALERRGVTPLGFSNGQLYGSADNPPYGLGFDFDAVYGCDQPKLTIDDPAGTTHMEQFSANEASIVARTPAGATLTYRDAWTPAWQATIDGSRVTLGRNNDGFKILTVPPGNHMVSLVYRPLVGERAMLVLGLLLALSLAVQIWLGFAGQRECLAIVDAVRNESAV